MARPFFPEVSVNGHVIDRTLIAAEAQNHAAPPGKPGWAWQAAARALAIRSVLLQRADLLAAHEMAAWGRAAQAYIGTLVSKATITGVTWDRPDGAGAKGQAGMR